MNNLDRRAFLEVVGKSCVGLSVGTADRVVADEAERLQHANSWEPGSRTVYRGKQLTHAAMPMGGLGAGSVQLAGRGSLVGWQIFNQCNPGSQLPGSFFAIHAAPRGGPAVAKILQLDPIGSLPTVDDIEMSGEYPFAWLDYKDTSLPVAVRLEAFNPLIPHNAKDSGLPGATFRFTLHNPSKETVDVSLVQACRNGVGSDGFGSIEEADGCVNRYERTGGLSVLNLTTQTHPTGAGLARPAVLLTDSRRAASIARFFHNVDLRYRSSLGAASADLTPHTTAMLAVQRGDAPVKRPHDAGEVFSVPGAPVVAITDDVEPGAAFDALTQFVQAGGRLLIHGQPLSLLEIAQTRANTRPDKLFDAFDGQRYDPAKWTVEGDAFGTGPAVGTLEGQQQVTGFLGHGLINSFRGGDGATGRMVSRPFTIDRQYIHFLIGGGAFAGETCINLRVDGKVQRTQAGRNDERLLPARWDVSALAGRQGVLEIVDARTDGWGHINLDQIVFSDRTIAIESVSPDQIARIRDFLPFTFNGISHNPEGPVIDGLKVRPTSGATMIGGQSERPRAIRWTHGSGTVVMSIDPPSGAGPVVERARLLDLLAPLVELLPAPSSGGLPTTHPFFGSMALATDARDTSRSEQWSSLDAFWKDFSSDGHLDATGSVPAARGSTWNGALAAHITLAPGASNTVSFFLGWHFPNRYRDRSYDVGFGANVGEYEVRYRLGNQYNNWFANAGDVARYLHKQAGRLRTETLLYHDTFYDSTLPYVMRDAISSQVCILRSQTSMWPENGRWMAYEGVGCCPMNCTHVYNYAQALARLWPELERSVRHTDLTEQLQADGGVRHRTQLPLSVPRATGPFTDGHLSTICKTYREHLHSPDGLFLHEHWPAVRSAMEFALKVYDANADGVVEGRQPNTYDCEVYGQNSFISTQFLAALRAAEEMAIVEGDSASAARYRGRFALGSANLNSRCWNGEYYQQVFPAYMETPTQYGPGCLADQVLGQWWAHILNLGYLLPAVRVRSSLAAILKYNFVPDFTDYNFRGQRVFANGRDQGVIICSWPRGGRPVKVQPILYDAEVWTGVEYQVAAHMIYEGMTDEAMKVIAALRTRYDGSKRNPWDEIECSGNYGRAMASWSLLLAASGFHYDGPSGVIGFAPAVRPEQYRGFFTTASGWGAFSQMRHTPGTQENRLDVRYGRLELREVRASLPAGIAESALRARVSVGDHAVSALASVRANTAHVTLAAPLALKAGQSLGLHLTWG